jgi:mycothiol synthase
LIRGPRAYRGERDLERIVRLRLAIQEASPAPFAASPDRLRAQYVAPTPGWRRELALWEREGELVGLGECAISGLPGSSAVAYLRARVYPELVESGLADEMFSWGEAFAGEQFAGPFQIETSVLSSDTLRAALLEGRGYAADRTFYRMECSLDGLPAVQTPVPGYLIRGYRGEGDEERWVELYTRSFRDHYDFHPISREERRIKLDEAAYRPELDLVVESPDGELAAFIYVEPKEDHLGQVDWHIDLLGTDPAHQRRGLATWLVEAASLLVTSFGGAAISLEVDSESSTGAVRLYQRLGFVVTSASIDYRRAFPGR